MKRNSRELSIFSLSALDILATATGAFVLFVVVLMPYYRRTFDAHAEIDDVLSSTAQLQAQAEEIRRSAEAEARAAAQMKAEAERIKRAAAEEQAAATSLQEEAAAADGEAADHQRKIAEMEAIVQQRVIKQLDIVFVIDTTASMTFVLRELSLSMAGIINVLERLVPSLRVGVVAYRDHDLSSELLRVLPPTSTADRALDVLDFVDSLRAARQGGRTPQEALFAGMRRALEMPLRPGAKQTVIVIGDAAAHTEVQSEALILAHEYATSGPKRTVSTLFVTTESYLRFGSGDREFFASLAKAGGGEFNDHGGQMMESVLLSVLDG